LGSNDYDKQQDEITEARTILTSTGLHEAQGQTLISDASARLVAGDTFVPLANPLSNDMNVLRPSLLPGLLDTLRHNLSHKNNAVGVFEIGRVFSQGTDPARRVHEERRAAIALTGQRNPLFWTGEERTARYDIFDLKGVLETFFEQLGLRGLVFTRRQEPTGLLIESATIQLGKFQLGELGQVLPAIAKQYDLRDPVFLAEINLDTVLARRNPGKSFRALAPFPSIRRDVAMIVPETVSHDAVNAVVKQTKPSNLESVELFDVFRGKNVPAGQKSMAYAFTYRSPERTLTDAEVNGAHEKLVTQLKEKLQAQVRE
jgi:phenylalanyl-tRNA synthetase beta chain